MTLLWYYGLSSRLHEEVGKAVVRYGKKYGQMPTHVWFRTGTEVDAQDVQGLVIGYKKHVLDGHFEVGVEEDE